MRLHRKGGDSPIDLAETMLGQLAGWLPERAFRLHADGFYATVAGRGFVRIHVIRRDHEGKERDDFFFSTDLSLTPEQVIGGFAGRWSIEDTFKNTKQFLGGQELQTWKSRGPERAAMLSLWLSSVVWLWFLQQPRQTHPVAGPAWYPGKRHPSFQDALAAARWHLWSQRMKTTFGQSLGHTQNLVVLLKALSRAASTFANGAKVHTTSRPCARNSRVGTTRGGRT
jgi:hypothetical protein